MNLNSKKLEELLFVLKKEQHSYDEIVEVLNRYKEVQFVSFVAVDFSGNGTDEKIPVSTFLDDMDSLLKRGIQTDGSSVVLQNIATLDNAKVIILPDMEVDWYVDYNFENLFEDEMPVGTLRIPSFLVHSGKKVCSRSILKNASSKIKEDTMKFLRDHPTICDEIGIRGVQDVQSVVLTSATELEFWVQTPDDKADAEKLFASQRLKQQYWKRTNSMVRTALENTIHIMDLYGFKPEMGHKEVGGVTSKISVTGKSEHIMEQLEIDWKYDDEIHTCDKEHFIRHLVKDIFHLHKLEVTFRAKPIEGVAGSGKHVHIGIALKLKNGERKNLMAHRENRNYYTTSYGLSALMGILKNYEVINPFVAWTNDSINRLKPHFEAPICIVSSLGMSPKLPSRNRSILIGLIKEEANPMSNRFELRSPNPHNNVYLILSACYQSIRDGLWNAAMKMPLLELEKEFSKLEGQKARYLEKEREYRSEKNIFEYYSEEERGRKFGKPPKTVYENLINFKKYPEKVEVLKQDEVFTEEIIDSYASSILEKWVNQLRFHLIEDNMELVRSYTIQHENRRDISDLDIVNWTKINNLKWELMKDSVDNKCIFSLIKEALNHENYERASELQLVMNEKISLLKELYSTYKKNLF